MKKKWGWLIAASVILFMLLAISLKAEIIVGFEGWAYSKAVARMSPVMTDIVIVVTHFGDWAVVIAFCLLLMAVPKTRKTIALPVSIAVIVSLILNIALKNIFVRERPDILRLINETSYSFPSGHAMVSATLYTMLTLLVFKYTKSQRLRLSLSVLCLSLVIVIGFSRVYLGVHYAGDVIGGWFIGFAVSVVIYAIWSGNARHRLKEDLKKRG
jgi:undecaprenyl-diphosphatase